MARRPPYLLILRRLGAVEGEVPVAVADDIANVFQLRQEIARIVLVIAGLALAYDVVDVDGLGIVGQQAHQQAAGTHRNNACMKLAGYCRVSTENQKEEGTIVLQERALEEYCRAEGHELVALYKDEGVSGDQQSRPGLSKMFDFLECSVGIGGVVIYKLDRLARDLYMQEHIIRQLEQLGLTLISTKEPDLGSTDPMRIAFRQFQGIIAQLENTMITWRLSSGRLNKARKGGYAGGRSAYGYQVTADKDLAINPEQAAVVASILRMRRRKLSYHEIARRLNLQGIPAPNGNNWHGSAVQYIAQNPIYRGKYVYKTEKSVREDLKLRAGGQIQLV